LIALSTAIALGIAGAASVARANDNSANSGETGGSSRGARSRIPSQPRRQRERGAVQNGGGF
jgi:hypothetical protein